MRGLTPAVRTFGTLGIIITWIGGRNIGCKWPSCWVVRNSQLVDELIWQGCSTIFQFLPFDYCWSNCDCIM